MRVSDTQLSVARPIGRERFDEQSMVFIFRFALHCLSLRSEWTIYFMDFYFSFWSFHVAIVGHDDDDVVSIDQFSWDMIMWMRALRASIVSILCIYGTLERNKNRKHKAKLSRHQ